MHKYTKFIESVDKNDVNTSEFIQNYNKNNKKTQIIAQIIEELVEIFNVTYLKDVILSNKYSLNKYLNIDVTTTLEDNEISEIKFFLLGYICKFLSKKPYYKITKERLLNKLNSI